MLQPALGRGSHYNRPLLSPGLKQALLEKSVFKISVLPPCTFSSAAEENMFSEHETISFLWGLWKASACMSRRKLPFSCLVLGKGLSVWVIFQSRKQSSPIAREEWTSSGLICDGWLNANLATLPSAPQRIQNATAYSGTRTLPLEVLKTWHHPTLV